MTFLVISVLLSVFAVSIISFVGIFTLALGERFLRRIVFLLVSLSVGALFGDVFIHLIPEVFKNNAAPLRSSLYILLGILLFFVLEKFLYWHHMHGEDTAHEAEHIKPVGFIILFGDGMHNFLDGVIIGASYLVSVPAGIATTLAVMLHEIPQEIGDFGVLLHAGFTKSKALLYNFISALAAVAGAILMLIIQVGGAHIAEIVLPIAIGNFLYIAGSDLVPELHKTSEMKKSIAQFCAILFGLALMFALLFVE